MASDRIGLFRRVAEASENAQPAERLAALQLFADGSGLIDRVDILGEIGDGEPAFVQWRAKRIAQVGLRLIRPVARERELARQAAGAVGVERRVILPADRSWYFTVFTAECVRLSPQRAWICIQTKTINQNDHLHPALI
jgi:hypothetical protein